MHSTISIFKKRPSVIQGFWVTLGFSIAYLLLVVLLPLSGLFISSASVPWAEFWHSVSSPRVVHAYKVTFGISLAAALINSFFGLLLAWVLVRYRFFGKKILDAMVDLPFALPTAVAGIALAAIYAPQGIIGQYLYPLGVKIAFTPLGILVALVFVGFPFVVRTVEPILQDLERELEEAAASLGANRWQVFYKVIFPSIFPALLTGFALSFARGLGEYGSVIFIAGNMPKISEIVPLLIITKLEQYDTAGATAIASVMLLASFSLLLAINYLQKWAAKRRT